VKGTPDKVLRGAGQWGGLIFTPLVFSLIFSMLKKSFARTALTAVGAVASFSLHAQRPAQPLAADARRAPFVVEAESFGDLQTLRYEVPGFAQLSLKQKQLAYYLYEAALSGRDIIYDQKSRYGLTMRKTLEAMWAAGSSRKEFTALGASTEWPAFQTYCGRFWFSNGAHHHYGNEKFIPESSEAFFLRVLKMADPARLPLNRGETVDAFWTRVRPLFYDMSVEPKVVDLRANIDNVQASSVNFYQGVTQKEVEDFYNGFPTTGNAPSWGLNSQTVKGADGRVTERVWKSGGMYGAAIDRIIFWLQKAVTVAETPKQKQALELLVKYYQTGDLKLFDDYSVAWVEDTAARLDAVNGFIEVYNDPIGKKGSYEAVVSMKDMEATRRIAAIARQAQWFEDNSPLMPEHKKDTVRGITAKAITVIVESGDAAPSTPIGINLPNADWIRAQHGSKSVSLSNIIASYNIAGSKGGTLDEFGVNDTVKARIRKWGALASDLHTDMHECIGHASGRINPGVETTDKTLKNYASTLEEARADLVGLYYAMDPKLVEIGVAPTTEVGMAEYDSYMMNGLMTQLTRLKLGDDLEEAHMRNRQLNARWVYEMGRKDNVVEFVKRDGKTYVRVNDYAKLRVLFGQLLREIQRIKSEGDYEAGKALVETYGVKVDRELHREVLERFATLDVKPYRGFVQPRLVPVTKGGQITDVRVEYPTSFFAQMMEYGKKYAFLPVMN